MNIFAGLTTISLICCASVGFAAEERFSGNVVAVFDGDTVEVLTAAKSKIRVRLANIDAPEKDQPYGQQSKQFLSDMVYRKPVEVLDLGGDQYGRRIGRIFVNGTEVNPQIVSEGLAWVYTKYNTDAGMPRREQEARRSSKGLWADSKPVAPWSYRHAK